MLDISKINNVSTTEGGRAMNNLIASVRDKKTQNVIAAKAFGTPAIIKLFSWNPKTDELTEVDQNTTLNPQSAPMPTNAVFLVKEIVNGEPYFYVVPCSAEANSCTANLQKLGDKLACERNGLSACVPCSERLESNTAMCDMSKIRCTG